MATDDASSLTAVATLAAANVADGLRRSLATDDAFAVAENRVAIFDGFEANDFDCSGQRCDCSEMRSLPVRCPSYFHLRYTFSCIRCGANDWAPFLRLRAAFCPSIRWFRRLGLSS